MNTKRNLLHVSLALIFGTLISSCVGDLGDRVNSLEKELEGVKKEQEWARNEIINLKKLAEVSKNAISVKEVKALPDGYQLIMSHGDPIILKNGKDGKDGAKGQDGAPGAPGRDGQDGQSTDLSIEEKDGMIIITHNGKTYKLPIASEKPAENLLGYMAEYNIQTRTRGFETRHTTDGWVVMTHKQAKDLFSDITVDGVRYHLPTVKEWSTICPVDDYYVRFDQQASYTDVTTEGGYFGQDLVCKGDYKVSGDWANGGGYTVALRFKGSAYLSAWKYEYVDVDDHDPNRGKCLKLTCVMLPESSTVTIADLETTAFWDKYSTNTVVRILPCAGYRVGKDGMPQRPKEYGSYWALDERLRGMQAFSFYFDQDYPNIAPNMKWDNAAGAAGEDTMYYRSCRLFKTKE